MRQIRAFPSDGSEVGCSRDRRVDPI
jgi:hypothetical protein